MDPRLGKGRGVEQTERARAAFTAAGVRRGVRAALAITIGLMPFGLVVGMVADAHGLSLLETLLMSGLTFAGTSQLVALELWSDPAPVLAATLAALVINLRLAPMGAALAPLLDRLHGFRLWGTLATLVDVSFALTIAEMRAGRRDAGFLLGAGLTMWGSWMVMCGLGHSFGAMLRLPAGHPRFFAGIATLLAILGADLARPRRPAALGVAGAVALAAQGAGLGAPWPVLAARWPAQPPARRGTSGARAAPKGEA